MRNFAQKNRTKLIVLIVVGFALMGMGQTIPGAIFFGAWAYALSALPPFLLVIIMLLFLIIALKYWSTPTNKFLAFTLVWLTFSIYCTTMIWDLRDKDLEKRMHQLVIELKYLEKQSGRYPDSIERGSQWTTLEEVQTYSQIASNTFYQMTILL